MDSDGSYGLVHFYMVPLLVQIYRSWMVSLGRKICSAQIPHRPRMGIQPWHLWIPSWDLSMFRMFIPLKYGV